MLASSLLLIGLAAGPAAADSSRVVHVSGAVDSSRTTSALCPFPVLVHTVGTLDDQFVFDADGRLVRILETVRNYTVTYSANGKTLTAIATGGFTITFGVDGSVTGRIFGINELMTVPGHGAIVLDVGHEVDRLDLGEVLLLAGPREFDRAAFCGALA